MNCTDPNCYLSGNEHEHMGGESPAPQLATPKKPLKEATVRNIAKHASIQVLAYWLEDFMRTHGKQGFTDQKEVLETVAYSLGHFAEDYGVKGILGLDE